MDGTILRLKTLFPNHLHEVALLCYLNDIDIQLWEAVTDELNRRASYVYNFETRYEDFVSRCNGII